VRLAGVIVVCTVILMGGDLHRLRGHAHPVSAHLNLGADRATRIRGILAAEGASHIRHGGGQSGY
jgi:hypothetical protein